MLPNPVIVLPGITATYLNDEYPVAQENIWAVINKDYDRISLHPDDMRYERLEPARVLPGQVYEICYKELVEELRHNLRQSSSQSVPVYLFGYDWRQPLEQTEEKLAAFVEEVIARTKLLRHYDKDDWSKNPRVNLVGHSMGGLIVTGYLDRYGIKANVGKVVTLAAPFDGSLEAVVKVTTGTADLGTSAPSSREREAARMTPALYYLMPGFTDGISYPKDLEASLFNPDVWQPSILQTIKEYIDEYGLNPSETAVQAKQIFSGLLVQAKKHRERINNFKLQQAGLTTADWLCVVGVGCLTRVKLTIKMVGGAPVFEFHSYDRQDDWKQGGLLTGDSTVPLHGAVPKFLKPENIVCVTPDDFGYWELVDTAFVKTQGLHGFIPAMDMLHRMIARHFTGRDDPHKNTWGRKLPGVMKWDPPMDLGDDKETQENNE
jgi:pimeloyl-ACP methyl ester carboxylesterase